MGYGGDKLGEIEKIMWACYRICLDRQKHQAIELANKNFHVHTIWGAYMCHPNLNNHGPLYPACKGSIVN